jgi:gamma-glutamylcyclotransferase (GGCT)/AIG2-like uncharacterized protein YtfP
MQAKDIVSESYQLAQKERTKTGYIHREYPRKNLYEKPAKIIKGKKETRGKCYLPDEKKSALLDYIKTNLMDYTITVTKAFDDVDKSLITDANGEQISWFYFKKLAEDVRKCRI